jgi:PAT family beta-lactamase induction signal transducer AmpG
LRTLVLCVLYLVQGIPTGFVTITLAAFLAEQGYGASAVAQLLTVTYVPWALKVAYAPLLDRYQHARMGRRRPWLVIAQGGMLTMLGVLLALPGASAGLWAIGGALFGYNLFGALQDVATDALAVDLLDDAERGRVSGAMWSSKIGGIVIGGAGMGTALDAFGWRPTLMIPAVLLLLAIAVPLLVRERASDQWWGRLLRAEPVPQRVGRPGPDSATPREERTLRDIGVALRQTFTRWPPALLASLALLGSVPTRMMVTYGPIFTVQRLGWTDAAYSQFAGGTALIAGAVGALLGGWLADRVGRTRIIGAALIGIVTLFLGFAAARPLWSNSLLIVGGLLVGIFLDMTLRMALQAVYMTWSQQELAATQFTIYMMMGNMSNVVGSGVVAVLSAVFEAQVIFVCAGLLGLLPLAVLAALYVLRPALRPRPA